MTHRVHPYSHRLGVLRDWKSRWFSSKDKYKMHLKGDVLIRRFLEKKLKGFYVADIEIERSAKHLRIIISSSRPGMIIGRQGDGAEKLRQDLKTLLRKYGLFDEKVDLKLDIKEIKNAEANSAIVAQMIVEGLEKRLSFRRVMKQTVEKVMANRDVEGVKVMLAGMITSGMSRTETHKKGRIPLQTLRADVDYASDRARLPLGSVGVKVWIYRGEIFANAKN
ncbi:MAG: 30S ribosomal protein S3 [Candidatus Zambryskibacteria bacterium RIFCSPHIGHO2_01_FULL_49_18]|uniref:Small ribosomal subunit protein uS3 n=2 Tax=Candidatus Zambryskiibacteriota TaxID=1817925 RepID=A0A1G2T3F6_9BACT|nr:MAG: 30S ribosomal protein S3 [Candidatus Zambryskibacteria bacterium RIFCSPHIGHO2_01_FULL_49_18]OHB05635.1 MAG: 30S ribosomal protein S3 [Candidatus Zambryskibacteria bacterium RIFCSPLOWO2_01_FULL_47_14]